MLESVSGTERSEQSEEEGGARRGGEINNNDRMQGRVKVELEDPLSDDRLLLPYTRPLN